MYSFSTDIWKEGHAFERYGTYVQIIVSTLSYAAFISVYIVV